MNDIVDWMSAAIEANPGWAGLIFALAAFAESTAFIGAFVPATPLLLLVGGLLATGRLDPWEIIPAAVLGTLLGAGASFHMGRLFGRRLAHSRWLRLHRREVARARLFFSRFGTPSLIFGKYVLGPVQSLLPLVAGMVGMPRRRFWMINTIASILWVPVCLAPGFLATRAARHVPIASEWHEAAAGIMIVVSLGAAVLCVVMVAGRAAFGPVLSRRRKRLEAGERPGRTTISSS